MCFSNSSCKVTRLYSCGMASLSISTAASDRPQSSVWHPVPSTKVFWRSQKPRNSLLPPLCTSMQAISASICCKHRTFRLSAGVSAEQTHENRVIPPICLRLPSSSSTKTFSSIPLLSFLPQTGPDTPPAPARRLQPSPPLPAPPASAQDPLR